MDPTFKSVINPNSLPTSEQFRAARSWLNLTIQEVMGGSGLSAGTIRRLEDRPVWPGNIRPSKRSRTYLRRFYESQGFFFIEGRGMGRREAPAAKP